MDYLNKVFNSALWHTQPPTVPKWNKWVHRSLSDNHCEECLKLDEYWFLKEKTPQWPHHLACHCILENLSYNDVLTKCSAYCSYSKFNPYLFDPDNHYKHGKGYMLVSWGYSVEDSNYLKKEVEKQGLEKYINGDYELGLLDEYGQRINIRIEIPNKKNGGTVSFITGWMIRKDGNITLNTPYGGK